MKNLTTFPLRAALLLIALLAVTSQASATEFEDNGIYYFTRDRDAWDNPTEEFAIPYDCKNDISHLVIPEKVSYNGKTYVVKEVCGFESKPSLTSVVIGDSVQRMYSAFENCSNLSTLTIGKSVNSIGGFTGCHIKKLIYKAENEIDYGYGWNEFPFKEVEQVEIGNNVETIPNNFCYETKLTEVEIPASVKTICEGAFSYCSSLRYLSFSSSATEITLQNSVFANCGFLNLTIPASIIKMGKECFTGCRDLQSVKVSAANTHYDSRNNCNAIIETATNTLVVGCMNTVIPSSVKIIDKSAFAHCSNLTSIDIPNSVTEIRSSFNNTGLINVVIPNSVKILEGWAFAHCKQLTSVIIGDSVEFIGDLAFSSCEQLVNIQIPDNIKIVSGTDYRTGHYATFMGTPWYNSQPDGLLYIGKAAYHYLGAMPAKTELVIREGTYSISENAFGDDNIDHDCSGLISVSFPKSLRYIGGRAFGGCEGLTEIVIPDSVIMLGSYAFSCCSGLERVTIGKGMKTIEEYPFYRCSNLTSITCLATVPPLLRGSEEEPYRYILSNGAEEIRWDTIVDGFDEMTYTNATLFVPKGSEDAYKTAEKWKKFIHIVGIDVHTDVCDVNGDGVVNISDLNNVVNDILSGKGDSSMDVNGDGSVNISDINIIVQSILTSN